MRLAAPYQRSLNNIIRPLFRQVFETIPDYMRPKWKASQNMFVFPLNGAEIQIAGCNNGHEDDLRGTAAGLVLIDEAGLIDDLEYVVNDVLMPQLLTTGGNIIMASTPPRTPDHEFVSMCHEAEEAGNYSKHTIYESGYPDDVIERFCKEAGGVNSTTWKREYLCEFVVDENYSVIPEWNDRLIRKIDRDDLFKYYHYYEAMDIGGRDKTAILFGYYDFTKAMLVVEDEIIINRPAMTSRMIADTVKIKETDLLKGKEVRCRVADNNNVILLQDLGQAHGLHFLPTNKDDLPAMVNQLRLWVLAGKISINERCVQTIGCLKYAIWNDKRTEFTRSSTYGHYDALAALIYLVRNIDTHTNPIPQNLGLDESKDWINRGSTLDKDGQVIRDLFLHKIGHS